MALVLNTNIASMNAQRQLSNTQDAQATTFARLSSGLRINSAKDDAAGLYLSESQTKDIKGLAMATRNASDGISMAQTAEGALDQISKNLQRINELAIQSANGTYNDEARDGLQKEVDQLTQEITRIVETTEFNGRKLLNDDAAASILQIGFRNDASAQLSVGLEGGLRSVEGASGKFSFPNTSETFDTKGQAQGVAQLAAMRSLLGSDKGFDQIFGTAPVYTATAIPLKDLGDGTGDTTTSAGILEGLQQLGNGGSFTQDGMTFSRVPSSNADKYGEKLEITYGDKTIELANVWPGGVFDDSVTIADSDIQDLFGDPTTSKYSPLANEFFPNGAPSTTWDGASNFKELDLDSLGAAGDIQALANGEEFKDDFVSYKRSGKNLQIISQQGTISIQDVWTAETGGTYQNKDLTQAGTTVGGTSSDATDITDFATSLFGSLGKEVNGLASIMEKGIDGTKAVDISSQDSARDAIGMTRDAIDLISEIRATFGAMQNRFEAVISGNDTYGENLSAARSRIRDADFAEETSRLSQQQVLQQAGISVLSQANASSQSILSLLQ